MAFRILELEECLEHGRTVWIELREDGGKVVPVAFYDEHIPFLRFDAQDQVLMISVRAEYYGKFWRCWNAKPPVTDWATEKPEKKKR